MNNMTPIKSDYLMIDIENDSKLDHADLCFFGNKPFELIDTALLSQSGDDWNKFQLFGVDERVKTNETILSSLLPGTSNYQRQSISIVIDELTTNAFLHSNSKVPLVEIHWIYNLDKKSITLRISDNGGSLALKEILNLFRESKMPLTPNMKIGASGAGLGLFFCKEFSSQIYINVVQNKLTEVTCVVPYRPNKESVLVVSTYEKQL